MIPARDKGRTVVSPESGAGSGELSSLAVQNGVGCCAVRHRCPTDRTVSASFGHPGGISSVAGVRAPAFVERHCALPYCHGYSPVSPGCVPRPSLSAWIPSGRAPRKPGVAGVRAPAFVERAVDCLMHPPRDRRVAGVRAPAFVERRRIDAIKDLAVAVSPGCVPRPSLSDRARVGTAGGFLVSPGCVPRPSLSVPAEGLARAHSTVSPGCVPRPSLSVHEHLRERHRASGVAGVRAPAFVERCPRFALGTASRTCRRGACPGLR